MSCSQARLEANRLNAQRSSGPTSPRGKEASRENALKHGLTGAGVVVPAEDRAEVDQLARQLEAELSPVGSASGRLLARRAAALAVRLERCERAEEAVTADRVRHAATAYDEARIAEVARLWATIADDPSTNARRLRAMPEGVDLLLGLLAELRAAAAQPESPFWLPALTDQFDRITGRRPDDLIQSRCRMLSAAVLQADAMAAADGELDADGWRAFGLGEIVALIDAEVLALEEHRATLDHAAFARSRAEAGQRALVDPGPDASTCRRYEAAAERGFFRALAELRQLRHEAAARHPAAPSPLAPPAPRPATPPPAAPMGSFFPGHAAPPRPAPSSASTDASPPAAPVFATSNPGRPPGSSS